MAEAPLLSIPGGSRADADLALVSVEVSLRTLVADGAITAADGHDGDTYLRYAVGLYRQALSDRRRSAPRAMLR